MPIPRPARTSARSPAPASTRRRPRSCTSRAFRRAPIRGNAGPFCNFDPSDDGSQAGLNPALIYRRDVTVQRLVTAIHESPTWGDGSSAIVVVWDENDCSLSPNNNRVVVIVDTNYGRRGVVSDHRYTHFSLLKTMEAGFDLRCLNHACDRDVAVMSDLFAR